MHTPRNIRPTATRLRRLRRERGMRQTDLAAVLGRDHSVVSLWERGGVRPHPRTARALEVIFGEPIEALIAPDNENEVAANSATTS